MCSPWRWRCWAEDSPRPGPPPPPRSSSHTRRGSHSPAEFWYFTDMSQNKTIAFTWGQPRPRARRLLSVMLLHEEMSTLWNGDGYSFKIKDDTDVIILMSWYWCHDDGHLVSLAACLARECEVWSVSFPQPPRSSVSMLGQFRAKISRAWSPTFWREQIMNPESGCLSIAFKKK